MEQEHDEHEKGPKGVWHSGRRISHSHVIVLSWHMLHHCQHVSCGCGQGVVFV